MPRLALHDLHAAAGAKFGAPCGIDLPLEYGDAAAEYAAVRGSAGLLDHGHHGVLEVTGRDRAKFLHAMVSNDITSLTPGGGAAATFLDIHGKIQVALTVWVLEDRILLVTPPGRAEKTMEDFDKYLFAEKAFFRDATGESALLVLAGPAAPAMAARITGATPPDTAWSHVMGTLGGRDVRVVRGGGDTGEAEIWLVAAASDGPSLWSAAVGAGAVPVGLVAWDALRVEAGTALLGHDFDDTVLLPEIPFAHLVSYTKGCYIGQEVVVRIRDRGHVNRLLTGLRLEGGLVPRHGAEVRVGEDTIGRVTSGTWSFGMDGPVALAFVKRAHSVPGTAVTVVIDDHPVRAAVSALPFAR
jgi:folate-binding protein YgfZ